MTASTPSPSTVCAGGTAGVTVTVNRGNPTAVTSTNVVYITSHLTGTVYVGYVVSFSLSALGGVAVRVLTEMSQTNPVYHRHQLGERHGVLAGWWLDWLMEMVSSWRCGQTGRAEWMDMGNGSEVSWGLAGVVATHSAKLIPMIGCWCLA